jgi:hypothetical protein
MKHDLESEQAKLIREANAVTDVITISGKAKRRRAFTKLLALIGNVGVVFGRGLKIEGLSISNDRAVPDNPAPLQAAKTNVYGYCGQQPQRVLS